MNAYNPYFWKSGFHKVSWSTIYDKHKQYRNLANLFTESVFAAVVFPSRIYFLSESIANILFWDLNERFFNSLVQNTAIVMVLYTEKWKSNDEFG